MLVDAMITLVVVLGSGIFGRFVSVSDRGRTQAFEIMNCVQLYVLGMLDQQPSSR